MTTTRERTRILVHDIEHPIESGRRLAEEAAEGQSARTPALVLVGVVLVAGSLVALLLLVDMLLYYFE